MINWYTKSTQLELVIAKDRDSVNEVNQQVKITNE